MVNHGFASLSRSRRGYVVALFAAPFVLLAAVRLLGLMGLARLGVAGLVGAAFLTVVFARPRWGVYFLAFYVYSGLAMYLPGVVAMAVTVVLVFCAVLDLLSGAEFQGDTLFWSCALLFVTFALNSALVAHSPQRCVTEFVKIAKTLAVIFFVLHFVRTRGQLRGLAMAIFAGAVATVVFGLINLTLGIYTEGNVIGSVLRFSGAHKDPNDAASVMCAALPLGMFMVRHPQGRGMRTLAVVGVIVLVVAVFATFSRGAIFSFAVVSVAVIAREIRTRGGYLVIAGLLGLGILLTPAYYWSRIAEMERILTTNIHEDFSFSLRLTAMKAAWSLFLDHPWTGIGLNNFIERGDFAVFRHVVAHNVALEILSGVGIFGGMAYAGMLFAGLRSSVAGARHLWSRAGDEMRSLSYYAAVAQVSMMVSGFFLSIPFRYVVWLPVTAGLVVGTLLRREAQLDR